MASFVAACRAVAAEVVPGGGFVAAEGTEPVGEAEEDQAAWFGDAEHFSEHAVRVGYVFEDVGGERHVDGGGAEGERLGVGADITDGL